MTNDVKVPLVEKFKALGVGYYYYDWDGINDDDIEYGFDFVVANIRFGKCTLRQLQQVVQLIFDVGYKSQFSPKDNDYCGYLQRHLERSILNKLLADCTEDNRKLAVDILAVIDVQYKCESREK